LTDDHATRRMNLEGLKLEVLADLHDPTWYRQRAAFEEKASPLYQLICEEGFGTFVDVGANVGFISILARRACSSLRVLAIEPDPRLAELLARNLAANGVRDAEVLNAIAGDSDESSVRFSQNPNSTLDNRVISSDWPQVHVPMVRLDSALRRHGGQSKTFMKIDTQGFEERVIRGLEPWLAEHRDWMIKMEFAPDWLRSQGTDPNPFFRRLATAYEVAEVPGRIAYSTQHLDELFAMPLDPDSSERFVDHVVSLNRNGLGWVDLLLRPRLAIGIGSP